MSLLVGRLPSNLRGSLRRFILPEKSQGFWEVFCSGHATAMQHVLIVTFQKRPLLHSIICLTNARLRQPAKSRVPCSTVPRDCKPPLSYRNLRGAAPRGKLRLKSSLVDPRMNPHFCVRFSFFLEISPVEFGIPRFGHRSIIAQGFSHPFNFLIWL